MTGFGTGRASDGERVYVLEIRSVNHRFCDVRVRLPHDFAGIESQIEGQVRKKIERGRVEVSLEVSYAPGAVAMPQVDLARARGYKDAFDLLARELNLEARVTLEMVTSAPGVIRAPELVADVAELGAKIESALDAAITDLTKMRDREGAALREELRARLAGARALVDQIRASVPQANIERKNRLEQRLAELVVDRALDPARIAQEVAMLVDRADVTEELARLASHLVQVEHLFAASEPVGRKLDFMLQEMHRETNTIGSKTMSSAISHLVVDLKAELERMREQAQNVE